MGNRSRKCPRCRAIRGGLTNYNANDQIGTDTYDAEGNTTASNGTGYVYDFENHLIQANGITYVYDGDGNRVSKTVAGVTTTYLVDDQNPTGYAQVLQEQVQQSGVYPVEYVYGLEQFTRFRRFYDAGGNFNRETIFYEHDGHGSVRSLTDGNGTVLNTYDYDAFGNLLHSTGTLPNNYLFAGEQFDSDLGLYYNRARYLNTNTGRFWSMDSFEGRSQDPLSLHRYLYAGADPVNRIDPSGHEDVSLISFSIGTAISATIGAISGYRAEHSVYDAAIGGLRGLRNGALAFAAGAGVGVALLRAAPLLAQISSYSGPVLGFMAKALGITGAASETVPAAAGTVKLWRAVAEDELEDVIRLGDYGTSPSMGGKYFALTEQGAKDFAQATINAGKRMTITSIEVSSSWLDRGYQFVDPGGVGLSVHVPENLLPELYEEMGFPAIVDASWVRALVNTVLQ